MKTKIASFIAAAGLGIATMAGTAAAAPPAGAGDGGKPAGIACQQAGIATLKSLDLLQVAVQDGVPVDGVGTLDFKTVLMLHRTSPELFQTGGVSVLGGVPATWCDGI